MNRGWLELESDPGLFTLLIEDFGTQGVQVEEIYDLQKAMEGPVYGFIFLFKWIEERRSRRKVIQEEESFVTDENKLNEMFFAQQIIPNSCATHALLSVLLNCNQIKLGDTLTNFKEFCRGMNPEDKGYAIGNMPELARAHNSHARPEPAHLPEKQQGISTTRMMEAFHFVSYVSINGRLFELDGLKPYPIDHGPCRGGEDWTEKFRRVITGRLGMATGGEPYHDIRFNLMAVVPDKRQQYERKLKTLKANRQIVLEALQQMVNVTTPDLDPNKPKPEPAMTRSKAARAAVSVPLSSSTNQQQQQSLTSAEPGNQGGLKVKLRTRNSGNGATVVTPTGGGQVKFPAALDSHNYCKSPILEESGNKTQPKPGDEADDEQTDSDIEGADMTSDPIASNQSESKPQPSSPSSSSSKVDLRKFRGVKDKDIKIQIKVGDGKESCTIIPATVALTDVTKPLTIQTKFACSPIPSFESTDTASETGSNIHSPYSNSPPVFSPTAAASRQAENTNKARTSLINKLEGVVKSEKIDGTGLGLSGSVGEDGEAIKDKMAAVEMLQGQQGEGTSEKMEKDGLTDDEQKNKFSHQAFTPKDLLALLKNVEGEISCCEGNLRDEIEKRKKYKIDDCRRTHTYDQFICTFLSMLAEQGKLADLVEQHMLVKRRQGVTVGRLHKISKVDKRKRARPKRRR